jgi:hypothetical protein
MNDDARYQAALDRFFIEPEAISDEDISTLAAVDDALAEKAAIRRADALRMAADARHRKAMGMTHVTTKADKAEELAELIVTHAAVALARPRHRIKSLERSNRELEERIGSLEGRLLELEARDAARTVPDHVDP